MYYQGEFLENAWAAYREETGEAEDEVDPDAFVRYTYARALAHRQPRYAQMAKRGVTVTADEVSRLADEEGFVALIAKALEAR